MTPAWAFEQDYPWTPTEAVPHYEGGGYNPIVGPGTAFPADTGWAPTHDLYWQPKSLILNIQWEYTNVEGGDGRTTTSVGGGLDRCSRARELVRGNGTGAAVFFEHIYTDAPGFSVNASFLLEPDSRYIENRHYLKMVFAGTFRAFSSNDHFTTDRQFPPIIPDDDLYRVGYLEIVANPGRQQSVFLLPIWRYGPNELIRSVNGQITRRRWLPEEL